MVVETSVVETVAFESLVVETSVAVTLVFESLVVETVGVDFVENEMG